MNLTERIQAFSLLGERLKEKLSTNCYTEVFAQAFIHNGWFTPSFSEKAVKAIVINFLNENKLKLWLKNYEIKDLVSKPLQIALITAGNIPLAGFHDLLCILITGNKALIKLSSKDEKLMQLLINELIGIEPKFKDKIEVVERLTNFDAVIATGSNNTFRYFEYYFGKHPGVLRKNRNSVAVLTGNESKEELKNLGEDIFIFFGLGCRSVSKIYVPNGYNFSAFYEAIENDFQHIKDHNKYNNNYDYNKSIWLLNRDEHFDNGFLMLRENESLASPVAAVYYEYYDDIQELKNKLLILKNELQCIVSAREFDKNAVKFGQAQQPELWDYADGVDTIEVILGINSNF